MVQIESPLRKRSFPGGAAVSKAVLLAAAFLAAPAFAATHQASATTVAKAAAKPPATQHAAKPAGKQKANAKAVAAKPQAPGPLAQFGNVEAPADVVHVANWVSYTHNNQKKAFVLIDKKQAQLYVFDPQGKLKSRSPVLLGKAVGDQSVPGIGSKPFSQISEQEKTTPAGRFLAKPGKNNHGEGIIWIDYNASVSMHRMRKVSVAERRAERMESQDPSEHRISYGCVNVPAGFYNAVLDPTVRRNGAFVYVLPETRTPQQQFGSYDVTQAGAKAG